MQLNEIQFIQANHEHSSFFAEALTLVDRTQGKGILTLDYFNQCIVEPDSFLLLACWNGKLVGVASAQVLPQDGSYYYAPFGKEAVDLFHNHRVGSMRCASVLESLQGRGIGQELGRRRLKWLEEKGCAAAVGISWESGRPHTSARVFEKLGFERLARAEEFYVKMSMERGFICPVCGPPPCRCAASLYVRQI